LGAFQAIKAHRVAG